MQMYAMFPLQNLARKGLILIYTAPLHIHWYNAVNAGCSRCSFISIVRSVPVSPKSLWISLQGTTDPVASAILHDSSLIHGSLGIFHGGHMIENMSCTGYIPDSKVHGANMRPIWGRQDPGGTHVGPMNFAIWDFAISLQDISNIWDPYYNWWWTYRSTLNRNHAMNRYKWI